MRGSIPFTFKSAYGHDWLPKSRFTVILDGTLASKHRNETVEFLQAILIVFRVYFV